MCTLKATLIAFESRVAKMFTQREVQGMIHLSGGNEDELIKIFQNVQPGDWVFSTWRSHYHALLKGVNPERILQEIVNGHSMYLNFPDHQFFSSGVLSGTLPIAVGTAWAIKRRGGSQSVWVFVGDAAAKLGVFYESTTYAANFQLPITFIVEDNGVCVGEPTQRAWGTPATANIIRYKYEMSYPHIGANTWVKF